MNREIKFRGKTPDGKWITGSETFIRDGDGVWLSDGCDVVKVVEDTVGQFTGLCDANGREIYEGDVVNLCRTYRYDERFGIVTFHQEEVRFAALDISPFMNDEKGKVFWRMDKFFIEERKTKVIGNIHDNPELLKGGAK